MSEAATQGDEQRHWIVRHFDVLIAVLLGVAAILTAFAAYRASLDDGDALKNYSASTRLAADASQQWRGSPTRARTARSWPRTRPT